MNKIISPSEYIKMQCEYAANNYINNATIHFCTMKGKKIKTFGTGIILKYEDDFFIVSAAHVLSPETIHDLNIRAVDKIFPVYQLCNKLIFSVNPKEKINDIDISIMKIKSRYFDFIRENYFPIPIEKIIPNHSFKGNNLYLMFGYPESKSKFIVKENRFLIRPSIYRTYYFPQNLDLVKPENTDIKVPFKYGKLEINGNSDQTATSPHPTGFSGSGMWEIKRVSLKEKMFAEIDINPVAIMTDFNLKENLIWGTEYYIVQELLCEYFGIKGLKFIPKRKINFTGLDIYQLK